MNRSTYRFALDLQKHRSQISIAVFVHDSAVRLYISLTDGGNPYQIESGGRAVFYGKRPNDTPLCHNCMIDDTGRIIYDFNDQTAAVAGITNCQIRIYGKDGELITAPRFSIVADERLVNETDIEKLDDSALAALDEIQFAEMDRVEAEAARGDAEAGRVTAEEGRAKAETSRAEAESGRVANENARIEAEQLRQKFWEDLDKNIAKGHKEIKFPPISTNGWYRIAETNEGMGNYNALIQLSADRIEELANVSLISISGTYTEEPKITCITSSRTWWGYPVQKIRVVYPKTDGFHDGMKAYLDIQVSTAKEGKEVNLTLASAVTTGWNYYDELVPVAEEISAELYQTVEDGAEDLNSKLEDLFNKHKEFEYAPVTVNGWYRIAETDASVRTYNNLVQLYANQRGYSNVSLFTTSGSFSTTPEIIPLISSHYGTKPISKIRILYPTNYTGQRAFLEIYVNNAQANNAVTIKAASIMDTGWNFYNDMSLVDVVPNTHNEEVQSIDNDIDMLMESNAKKLDAYNNKNGELPRAYIAGADGSQTTYPVSSWYNASSIAVRDINGTLFGHIPANVPILDEMLVNVRYMEQNTTSCLVRKYSLGDVSEAKWFRIANMPGVSFGIFNIRANWQHKGSGCYTQVTCIVNTLYPSTEAPPKIVILHHNYRVRNLINNIRVVYNGSQAYLEIETDGVEASNTPSIKVEVYADSGITFPDYCVNGEVPSGYAVELISATKDINTLINNFYSSTSKRIDDLYNMVVRLEEKLN